ncbi:uracil-DNA glycosylase-like protein [Astrocystis sublimbata]|nr:uracil-DNA glycosylase-like protein [Astrocystis sublimbata]
MSSLKRAADSATAANKKPKTNGSITSFFGAPKTTTNTNTNTTSSSSSTFQLASSVNPASRFDKEKWVATLTPEQKKHLALEINTLDPSWLALLKDEIVKPEFIALKKFIEQEVKSGKTVFPPSEDVYSWSRHTPFHTVRCVILGQDPYHNHNQAHGLCFSVRPPTPAPPSLKNMYKALRKDYPSFQPPSSNSGNLTPWAERGVLMLNTCLTVRAHEANSHQKRGWEQFTQKCIDLVAQKRTRGVVFLAWGKPAGDRVAKVDAKKHCVLKSVHPSPLSASRGFFDCAHFKKCNEWLAERYGVQGEIDWNLNEGGEATTSAPKVDAKAAKAESKGDMELDDDDLDADAEAAMAEAAAEAEAEAKIKSKKGEKEDKADAEANGTGADDEPVPVVAVGKVEDAGAKEESDILAKQGEDGTVDGE